MSLGSFMENTFEHNTYHNHSHILSALRNAINTMRENDMLKNYRQVELADLQGLYDALVEHKDTYTATLKNKANISFNCIPCTDRPKSKFDLLAQNFGGDKHLIYCANKTEHFALLSEGFNQCKHYLGLFLDRHYMFIHKTTFFEGLDFIDSWDTQKKQVFLGVWFAIVWRDKNKDFVSLWEEFIKELDRLAFIPELKTREVEKQREVKVQKKVKEQYTERVFRGVKADYYTTRWGIKPTRIFSSWEDYRYNSYIRKNGEREWGNPRTVWDSVIKEREVVKEVVELETYTEIEEYFEPYDRSETLMALLTQQAKTLNIALRQYNSITSQGENNANQ